jgi:hypothetical protein
MRGATITAVIYDDRIGIDIHKLSEDIGPPENACPRVSTRAQAGACGRALERAAPHPKAAHEDARRDKKARTAVSAEVLVELENKS